VKRDIQRSWKQHNKGDISSLPAPLTRIGGEVDFATVLKRSTNFQLVLPSTDPIFSLFNNPNASSSSQSSSWTCTKSKYCLACLNQQLKRPTKHRKDKDEIIASENKLQTLGYVEYVKNLHPIKNFIPWRAVWKDSSISTPCHQRQI